MQRSSAAGERRDRESRGASSGKIERVTPGRLPHRRLYTHETIALANFLVIYAIVARANQYVITTIPSTFGSFIPTLAGYTLAGCAVRLAIAWWKGTWRTYLAQISTRGWLTDTARLILSGSLMVHTYFWIKLMMPLLHQRMFDPELWEIDRAMFFGLSPTVFFLNLFSQKPVLAFIDWAYARIFFASMTVAFAFFLSAPSRRLRAAFITGNSVMWLTGAWLYVAVPSLGPAFRFPDVWLQYANELKLTQWMQALLVRNLQRVLALGRHLPGEGPQLMFGIAAFPSLHVAFQTFAFLWMRRLWIYGQIVFGVFALIIVIGSVVTGWHYLIDGVAGVVLAALSYYAGTRIYRIRRWRHAYDAMSRPARIS